jgi:hypothetical protein
MSLIPQPNIQNIRTTPLTQAVGPNVAIRQLREVFRDAFDQLGGANWLVEFVQEDPANARVFVSAISKLLPAAVQTVKLQGDAENPLVMVAGSLKNLSDAELSQLSAMVSKTTADVTTIEPN